MSDLALQYRRLKIKARNKLYYPLITWIKNLKRFFLWSFIATYGNSPIVKLAILTPLLAQVLIHTNSVGYFQPYISTKLNYAYWSLMCFFVAQLFYNFFCHRDIKNYPSEIKYTEAMLVTNSDEQLNREYFEVYKKRFKRYGGAIDQDIFSTEKAIREVNLGDLRASRETGKPVVDERNRDCRRNVVWVFESIKNGKQHGVIDWKLLTSYGSTQLELMFQVKRTDEMKNGYTEEQQAVMNLVEEATKVFHSSHWRAKVIELRYDKLNNSKLPLRYLVGSLFAIGTVYFAYTGMKNVFTVLCQYDSFASAFNMCSAISPKF